MVGAMTETTAPDAPDAAALITTTAHAARQAQRRLAEATREHKDAALRTMAAHLRVKASSVLAANALDLERARAAGMRPGLIDRLALSAKRIEAICIALEEIAALPDPVGQIVDGQRLPNGLRVRRVRVPMGVVGMIYEVRPNVTADVAALTIKSGKVVDPGEKLPLRPRRHGVPRRRAVAGIHPRPGANQGGPDREPLFWSLSFRWR